MAETLVARLLRPHPVGGPYKPGEEAHLCADQVPLEDYTGTMDCLQYAQLMG